MIRRWVAFVAQPPSAVGSLPVLPNFTILMIVGAMIYDMLPRMVEGVPEILGGRIEGW